MAEHGNIWVKVSCPERLTVAGPPYNDVVPFARRLVETFPDRVLWGTDEPQRQGHARGIQGGSGGLLRQVRAERAAEGGLPEGQCAGPDRGEGDIYCLAKFAGIFNLDVLDVGAQQTGMTKEEFKEKLRRAGD